MIFFTVFTPYTTTTTFAHVEIVTVTFKFFTTIKTYNFIFTIYDNFICKLCEMARNLKRVTAKEKEVENAKYAFRCFLLRLGFIGDEYKTDRKLLLKNLSGSAAFKSGKAKEAVVCSE